MLRPLLVTALVVATSAPASGQPEPCSVTIARAPDDVRVEIEAWVRAEPRCVTPLEVRVVETAGGLYLFARDGRGFTRERIVPDGRTAGALVASWIADDSIDGSGSRSRRPRSSRSSSCSRCRLARPGRGPRTRPRRPHPTCIGPTRCR